LIQAPGPVGLAAFSLSQRQIEVLRLLGEGQGNKEMARALGIAASTVKLHVQQVLKKLGVANRLQAVILAYRHGMLTCADVAPAEHRTTALRPFGATVRAVSGN
jgi:DNA-binding NarL/FixJ family response regulator